MISLNDATKLVSDNRRCLTSLCLKDEDRSHPGKPISNCTQQRRGGASNCLKRTKGADSCWIFRDFACFFLFSKNFRQLTHGHNCMHFSTIVLQIIILTANQNSYNSESIVSHFFPLMSHHLWWNWSGCHVTVATPFMGVRHLYLFYFASYINISYIKWNFIFIFYTCIFFYL